MSTLSFDTPTPYADHVPDESVELDGNGLPYVVPLPGHIVYGFIINGVKVPIGRKGTAGVLADAARLPAPTPPPAPAPAPPGVTPPDTVV